MSEKVKGLLQRINLIETDMDLHKQILHSIPSADKAEIQETLEKIADQKAQIDHLRQEIKKIDIHAYNKMVAIENASTTFKQLAATKQFVNVKTPDETGACPLTLANGSRLDCLVAAQEQDGNWTIMTLDGEIKEYPAGIIK